MIDIDDNLIFDDDELAMLSQEFLENPEYSRAARHLIFVYGTMKRGCANHNRLHQEKTTKFVGEYFSAEPMYRMFSMKRPNMIVPAVRLYGSHYVKGELYEVSGITLATLDLCEGHPSVYKRKLIEVKKTNFGKKVLAQQYECSNESLYDSPIVGNGKEIRVLPEPIVNSDGLVNYAVEYFPVAYSNYAVEYFPEGTTAQCKRCKR